MRLGFRVVVRVALAVLDRLRPTQQMAVLVAQGLMRLHGAANQQTQL